MKTALITGASRGIGRETARLLAARGYAVAIHYHESQEQARELVREIRFSNGTALAVRAEISNASEVSAMLEAVRQQLGGVEVLVNNAGISQEKMFQDLSEEEWDRMFQVHVKGAFLCTQAVLPDMLRLHQGSIVNVSSIWGMTGASCEVHYSAAKAALIGMTKALAKELGPSGIRVNCVAPGVIDTDMNRVHPAEVLQELAEETPLGALGRPEEVAAVIGFLASPEASFLTGQVLSPNGGLVI